MVVKDYIEYLLLTAYPCKFEEKNCQLLPVVPNTTDFGNELCEWHILILSQNRIY